MIGVGLDVVELDRFRRVLQRTPTFVDRVFTPDEIAYAERRRDPTERYAVRFAAKEAVLKAMGVGLWSCPLPAIEVVRADSGEPAVVLHGSAAGLAAERGIVAWHLTLTHTDVTAQAIAIAFGADGAPSHRLRVELPAADPSRTVAFYEDVLGFVVVADGSGDGVTRLVLGDAEVRVVRAPDSVTSGPSERAAIPAADPVFDGAIVVEVAEPGAARRRALRHLADPALLIDDGGDPGGPDGDDGPRSTGFAVRDPDGRVVRVERLRP